MRMDFPRIQYYDQSFVDLYNRSWFWLQNSHWQTAFGEGNEKKTIFSYPESESIYQLDVCLSTFFLVYSNRQYSAIAQMDNLYRRQESDGAIRYRYHRETGEAILDEHNPEGLGSPLFAWVEYNLYHKVDGKQRLNEVLPVLVRYFYWVQENFFDKEKGLLKAPLAAVGMRDSPRDDASYLIDINAQQALSALYISKLANLINNKELSFQFKKHYFSYKTKINQTMWDEVTGFYYDLDDQGKLAKVATLASYWVLLAELANDEKSEKMWVKLDDQEWFFSENPFPSLAIKERKFSKEGHAYYGSVYPHLTFLVIKALERYQKHIQARNYAIRHIYHLLDTYHRNSESSENSDLWEAYAPFAGKPAGTKSKQQKNRRFFTPYIALSTINLMLENIIGLSVSLPQKTVVWTVPTLEIMGIENLYLKRNIISIFSNRSGRGWEIRLDSEKLYYFTIDLIGHKRKTLPIPSGRCSMLVDKL